MRPHLDNNEFSTRTIRRANAPLQMWHNRGMPSGVFQNNLRTLQKQNLETPCKLAHKHKVAVINAYDVDLYQSWTIEMEYFFRVQFGADVTTVQIGLPFLDRQRSVFRQLTIELARRVDCLSLKILRRYLITYSINLRFQHKYGDYFKAFSSTWRIWKSESFESSEQAQISQNRSIYSTLASSFQTVEFNIRRHPLKLLSLSLAYQLSYSRALETYREISPCFAIVGNGRLVKAAAVVASYREAGTPIIIIERGAFPGTFDLYLQSPHSILERRQHAQTLSKRFGQVETRRIAESYVELRKEYDPISGLKWQRNFKTGELPQLDRRKICVCFTSTETEFAVFGDVMRPAEFQNQADAFLELALSLNPNEWQVVIRRHPYGAKITKTDPEFKLWAKFGRLKHVSIVGPGDSVDSYELCRKADLIAHFNSSMGPEAIGMERCPVITMGPTIWEREDSEYLINTREKVKSFLVKDLKVRPLSDIELWGIYWATFGFKFEVITWSNSRGYICGKRIL